MTDTDLQLVGENVDLQEFTFDISLTVLNHLGRQLYRNFITIIGEAVSNSWDADAQNVWIEIDRESGHMSIIDDGIGMTSQDLQHRFLKIGYSKRVEKDTAKTLGGRPFIGAKGIGKLALLSCAARVSVVTKYKGHESVGCLIDNAELDAAIQDDLVAKELPLGQPSSRAQEVIADMDHGTMLDFDAIKASGSSDAFLRKAIAHYFRFSLVDPAFKIHFNGSEITVGDLSDLAKSTQYLWSSIGFEDPLIKLMSPQRKGELGSTAIQFTGFIASVQKPSDLNIYGARTRVGIDLFVNGRLRETGLQDQFPTARVAAQYLYGQIHLDALDAEIDGDPFTSNREGVSQDNALYAQFLESLEKQVRAIIDEWDAWRIEDREDGDPENTGRKSPVQRASANLMNELFKEILPKSKQTSVAKASKDLISSAFDKSSSAAAEDFVLCYVAENLLRGVLRRQENLQIPNRYSRDIRRYRDKAKRQASAANIAVDVRQVDQDIYYLDFLSLADLVDRHGPEGFNYKFSEDSNRFALVRNAVMHTSQLTDEARVQLQATSDNLKAKLTRLLMHETK